MMLPYLGGHSPPYVPSSVAKSPCAARGPVLEKGAKFGCSPLKKEGEGGSFPSYGVIKETSQ